MTQSSPQPLPPPPIGYGSAAGLVPSPERDAEHLRLLAMFHYIAGGLIALFSSFGLIHIFFGVMMLNDPKFMASQNPGAPPPPPFMGWMFLIMGCCFVLFGWSEGALTILSGRKISRRRGWLFSMVVAGINCLWMPIGTILGVFTFIVLARPSVKAMYGRNTRGAAA